MPNLQNLQFERYAKGETFEEQIRRSWTLIRCWRRKLRDGNGLENPGDELILLNSMNLLCEHKRTTEDSFKLSMLREGQKKGLIEFEKALDKNISVIFIDFEKYNKCYAFRFIKALKWMKENNRKNIPIEVFRKKGFPTIFHLPKIDINGEIGYDVRKLFGLGGE